MPSHPMPSHRCAPFAARCLVAALALLATVALLAAPPAAANEYEDQIKAQLVTAAAIYIEAGYEPSHEPIIDSIDGGETFSTYANLDAGYNYIIISVCDVDCSDVDLHVYDASGELIDKDVLDDDVPVAEIEVYRSSRFRIETSMYECSYEPCYFGVGIFAKPTQRSKK